MRVVRETLVYRLQYGVARNDILCPTARRMLRQNTTTFQATISVAYGVLERLTLGLHLSIDLVNNHSRSYCLKASETYGRVYAMS